MQSSSKDIYNYNTSQMNKSAIIHLGNWKSTASFWLQLIKKKFMEMALELYFPGVVDVGHVEIDDKEISQAHRKEMQSHKGKQQVIGQIKLFAAQI